MEIHKRYPCVCVGKIQAGDEKYKLLMKSIVREAQIQAVASKQVGVAPEVLGMAVVVDSGSRFFKYAIVQSKLGFKKKDVYHLNNVILSNNYLLCWPLGHGLDRGRG